MNDIPLDLALRRQRSRPAPFSGEPPDPAPGWDRGETAPRSSIRATPYTWRDPRTIPPRQWLYDRHYVRRYVTTTVSPGGVGKSSLALVEAVAMASGRPLLGVKPARPLTVWVWNGEDPRDEIERRVAAILIHYDIDPEEIAGRLYLDSGRDVPIVLASMGAGGAVIAEPVADEIEREMRDRGVDCLILDPFVSTHSVSENDNGAVDRVAKRWAKIADRTGASVELIHHSRKLPSGAVAELTVDDARGAVALIGAVRSARVLNVMSKEEAERTNIAPEQRRTHFRVDDGKANMVPPLEKAVWRRLVNVDLDNATDEDPQDHIGVATAWTLPGAFDDVTKADLQAVQKAISEGQWRADAQAKGWAGQAVADVLGLDLAEPSAKQKIKQLLATWTRNSMFREVTKPDAARRPKLFLEVDQWA